ncbi:hypothetical protein AVEN_58741-1 [Araneus ventricosus]|uniref:Uncharacterized protein n=1 Tax=Araneus ventricosus TaxID=182803 RepID=A0A4Y2TSE9_ARAVE|nr:hypothetical protein AVEN_58741-1 [Araneus ventricosus]
MEEAAFSRTDVWEAMRMRKSVMEGEPISGKAPLLHLSNIDTCDSDRVLRKMWQPFPQRDLLSVSHFSLLDDGNFQMESTFSNLLNLNIWLEIVFYSISTIKAEHLKHFPNNAYLRRVEFTRIISNVPPATLPASSLQSFSFRSTDSAVPWWPLEGSWPLSPRYYARSLWVVSHTHRATSQSIYRSEESLKGSDLQQEKSRCPNPIKESRKLS